MAVLLMSNKKYENLSNIYEVSYAMAHFLCSLVMSFI